MARVLIADPMHEAAVRNFEARGIDVDISVGLSPAQLAERIGGYDGLAVRSATTVSADILNRGGNLKIIGRAGIGVDNIDIDAATRRGIVVVNTPNGNAVTTAELTIAMMLSLARRIPQANASTHQGRWEKKRFTGMEVTGKTLGIIGCGNIGSVVAHRAIGLCMSVLAYDPYLTEERAVEIGVEKTDIEDLFGRSDIITLHTPLTETTRNIIDRTAIAAMKPGVLLVNCARGGLIAEADLRQAIVDGLVAGAAVDVFETEPARENVLFGLDQVIATPHLGASTNEAQEKVAAQMADQMADYLMKGVAANAVNLPSISREDTLRLRPYRKLADRLGRFVGQIVESALKTVTVEYAGHAASIDTRQLTPVILAGLLAPFVEAVNSVNAAVAAQERGIDVRETTRERATIHQTRVGLRVDTEAGRFSASATLFGDEPLIADVQGVPLDAPLAPNMLFLESTDQPGVIAAIGKVLGDAGINIASFHLGRKTAGGDANCLIEIDGPPPAAVIDALQGLPQVVTVRPLRF